MYAFFSNLLSDKKTGTIFSCFGLWHLIYLFIAITAIAIVIVCLKNKGKNVALKTISALINCAFGLYIADFFLMPFAYGEIDVEKLPFHVCTAMCVMCFLSRHNAFLGRYRQQFALLGFISNLVYMIYPAGLMWYQVHPFSYRVIQTLLFHGLMTAYGLLVLLFDEVIFDRKQCCKDLAILVSMTLWAILGNTLYTGEAWGHTNNFNWFFTTRDPFYILPENIAPYIMPFLNITIFFVVERLVSVILKMIRQQEILNKSA